MPEELYKQLKQQIHLENLKLVFCKNNCFIFLDKPECDKKSLRYQQITILEKSPRQAGV
jgi:hypothetical protein